MTPLFRAMTSRPCQRIGFIGIVALSLAGCGRDEVKSYIVPKEQAQTTQPNLPPGHPEMPSSASTPPFAWTTPDGWKEVAPGEVRVASFQVTGKDGKQADVSVVPLPGRAGGDLSNVNRWRGQVGQPPISEEELKKLAQPVEVGGQPAELYEQTGDSGGEPTSILAVIQHRDDTAWFYKMTGDSQLVAEQKPTFVQFLKTVRFERDGSSTGLPPSHPPVGAATAAPVEGKPQWQAPPGWKETPGGQFLVAKFTIAGAGNAQAAVNISSSAGDGGGLAANVNRWRKQLGLSELSNTEIASAVKTIGTASFIEMNGERASLVAAIVAQPGSTWFYKLMGDPTIVAAQKDPFTKFVQDVRY